MRSQTIKGKNPDSKAPGVRAMAKTITFKFDGRTITARDGQSVAAALGAAGVTAFRATAKGSRRGVFCGMGVCQDCLVTIDGTPDRRACMTAAREGLCVKPQPGRRVLADGAPDRAAAPARELTPDVLVVGGGAGGLSAAIAARAAGASVLVVDERKVGGGQYYKQSADGSRIDGQQAEGAALIAEAEASGARMLGRVEIWGAFAGPLFFAECEGEALVIRPRTVIVATGAYERPRMVPGWTLPGVMTTGAAQTFWRSYGTLPGRRVVFCGSGPLNLQVALELASGGARLGMVAERAPSPLLSPFRGAAMVLAGPGLSIKGIRMKTALAMRGIPFRYRTSLARVDQAGDGLMAVFRGDSGRETRVETDIVCMNEGFEPQNELLRLLGAGFSYDADVGHLRCGRDDTMETSVPGVFAVGDCAGLGGAPAARVEGRIAGRAAAERAGFAAGPAAARDLRDAKRELQRHRRFQSLLWQLHDVSPRDAATISDETVLCRCEEVTFGDVRRSLRKVPGHAGGVKRSTRVGMGACQGRYCGPVAARLAAEAASAPVDERAFFAPRVPVKPVSISSICAVHDLLGDDA